MEKSPDLGYLGTVCMVYGGTYSSSGLVSLSYLPAPITAERESSRPRLVVVR